MALSKATVIGVAMVCLAGAAWAQGVTTAKGPNPEAAKIKSPVTADTESLARGQKLYAANCASCHKATGEGSEGDVGEGGPPPSNLLRAQLEYGSSDGEIHRIIKTGVLPMLYMPMYEGELSDNDMWDITNYVQSLRAKK